MRRLSLSVLTAFFTTTAYAFSPVCPEFTAVPTAEPAESLTGVLIDLAEAIKKKDVEHLYALAVDDVYLGDGFETRLGEYGLHNRRSPMWNELGNALYAGCALLDSGQNVWECPGVRDDLFLEAGNEAYQKKNFTLFFGASNERFQKKKYSSVVNIARPVGAGGPLLGEPFAEDGRGTFCDHKPYSTHESFGNYHLPQLEYIREAMEEVPEHLRAPVPNWFYYRPGKPVVAWFKYSHYRMQFKEIDGKWRMTALFRKY